jgi:hypothetical protein
MAGMGPPPKPAGMRQRRNKGPQGTTLSAEGSKRPAPPLPDRQCPGCDGSGITPKTKDQACPHCEATGIMPWHPLVLQRWADVWASPMATEFLDSDVHGLYVLADLWDLYWKGDKDRAAEIRLQEQRFGLSALDRRRLQWEVEKVEQAQRRRPPSAAPPVRKPTKDPRAFLKAVK